MATIDERAAAYESSRDRIAALASELSDESLGATVPCCPEWTVKDLVGHLTGLLEDRLAGRMPTQGFEEWTHAQVARYRGESIDDVLAAWQSLPVQRDDAPPSLAALSFDVVSHEHDLCQAVGVVGDRTSFSVHVGAERARERMGAQIAAAAAPGVLVTTASGTALVEGVGEPIALETSDYHLMRLVTGRVSHAQAASMAWSAEPTLVLDALFADGFFTLQPHDVVEADEQ